MKLTIERLTKQYKNKIAVDRVDLELKEGVYGLLGANGAGKTTLMRMICGIITPTSGEVKVDGKNNLDMGEEFRDILGYLPQDFGCYPDFTGEEFLLYIASLKGLLPSFAKGRIQELTEMVGLTEVRKKRIKTYSGGMKQRLGIAQAILNNPKILILDEPTAGLDPKERVRFRNIISDLGKSRIVLLSTHIVSDVEAIADEILLMKDGQLKLSGSVQELEREITGKVWHYEGKTADTDQIIEKYNVANVHHQNQNTVFRIISDDKPFENAVSVDGTLEDLYLYYFEEG